MVRRREFVQGGVAAAMVWTAATRPRAASAQAGKTVRIATFSPLSAFDPLGPFTEAFIMRAVFPPLTRVTKKSIDPLAGWEPYAATPSAVNRDDPNNPYIEIKAEPLLTWSGGQRNTVHEIMRGIERAKARSPQDYRSAFDNIVKLEFKDDSVCRAYLQQPDTRLYKEVFSRTWATPLTDARHKALEARAPFDPEALGPYVFADPFRPGDVVTLKANPAWKRNVPGVENFSIQRIGNVDAAVALFRAGEIDLVLLPSGRILSSAQAITAEFGNLAGVKIQPIDSVTYVAIDVGRGPTGDPRVRQAARAAVDPGKVVAAAFGGDAEPTSDILPAGFTPERGAIARWYDPARARQRLAEAGFPQGFEGELLISPAASEGERRAAANVREQLASVNIRLTEVVIPLQANRRDRPLPTFLLGRTPIAQTPAGLLSNFTSRASGNLPGLASPQFDKAVEELFRAAEGSERLLSRSREILEAEAVAIPLFQERRTLLSHRTLRAAFAPDGTLGDLVDIGWIRA